MRCADRTARISLVAVCYKLSISRHTPTQHRVAQHRVAQHSTAQQSSPPVPGLGGKLQGALDSSHTVRQQAEGSVGLQELGLGDASLGSGGQQIAAEDLRPSAVALVEDARPAPSPALAWPLLVDLHHQQF